MDARSQKRKWLGTQVLAALDGLDAYKLEPGMPDGAPADEYEPEAGVIVRHLLHQGAVAASEVDAIWSLWFGETLTTVVGAEAMNALIVELNGLAAKASELA